MKKHRNSDNKDTMGMHAGATPEIFRFAAKLRAKMTPEEKRLWEFLKIKPLGYKFRRQHPFSKYVLDFYCHKAKLSIEVDGKNHFTKKQQELDTIRTQEIKELGIKELRFTNEEIRNEFGRVKDTVINELL